MWPVEFGPPACIDNMKPGQRWPGFFVHSSVEWHAFWHCGKNQR
jgi:hypothetical protein